MPALLTKTVAPISRACLEKTKLLSQSAGKDFQDVTANLSRVAKGTHKLYFKFKADGILVDTWEFSKDEVAVG